MNLSETLAKLFGRFLTRKDFTFRFDEYDGSEENTQIYDAQVVEYEFINTGTTICIINSGLKLYPKFAGIEPTRVKLAVNYNEMDITIYNYDFQPLDLRVVDIPVKSTPTDIPFDLPSVVTGGILVTVPNDFSKDIQTFNRLIVISKVKASLKKRKEN